LAIIAVPPGVPTTMPDGCEMRKLGDSYRWFLKAPMAIYLRNGVVEPAKENVSDEEAKLSGFMAW